ncbi:MAG: sulfotransferase domain-containing protein [Limisphaerales bacterium]
MPDSSALKSIRPVWLASYPRSGNTFLRILLQNAFHLPTYSIYHVEDQDYQDPSAEAIEAAVALPKNLDQLISRESGASLTVIKTHEPPRDQSPAIYIARDGRAAIDSYFHYHQRFAIDKPSLTEVIAGACQFGKWSEHYAAWMPRTRPNTLFLRYEDLVARPAEIIPQIAQLLAIEPVGGKLPTFDELKQRSPAFFRRGQNQDYLTKWSPGQMALFNWIHGPAMEELGYALSPAPPIEKDTVIELARAAGRLHGLYLENLRKLGASWTQCQQFSEEARKLREAAPRLAEIERELELLRGRPWARLGTALGLMPKSANVGKSDSDANRSSQAGLSEAV